MKGVLEGLALARRCASLAGDKKAEQAVILDLRSLEEAPAEWFVIVSGLSQPQLKAIADAIEEGLRVEAGLKPFGRDGKRGSQWLVLDYGPVLVHIFERGQRAYYRLEELWSDAARPAVE